MSLVLYPNGFMGEDNVDLNIDGSNREICHLYENISELYLKGSKLELGNKLHRLLFKVLGNRPFGAWVLAHKGLKEFGTQQNAFLNNWIDYIVTGLEKYDIEMFVDNINKSTEHVWTIEENKNFKEIKSLSIAEVLFKWINSVKSTTSRHHFSYEIMTKYLYYMFGSSYFKEAKLAFSSNETFTKLSFDEIDNEGFIDSFKRFDDWLLNEILRIDARFFNIFFNLEKRAHKLVNKLEGLSGLPKDGSVWKILIHEKFISVDGKIASLKDIETTTNFFKKCLDNQHEFIIEQDKKLSSEVSNLYDLDNESVNKHLEGLVEGLINNFDNLVDWNITTDPYIIKRATSDQRLTVCITDTLVGDYYFYKSELDIDVNDTFDLIKKMGSIDVGVIENKAELRPALTNTVPVMKLDDMKKAAKIILDACRGVKKLKFYESRVKKASKNIISNLQSLMKRSENNEITKKLIKAYIKRLKETLFEPYGTCASRIHYTYAELIDYMEKCAKQYT